MDISFVKIDWSMLKSEVSIESNFLELTNDCRLNPFVDQGAHNHGIDLILLCADHLLIRQLFYFVKIFSILSIIFSVTTQFASK